MEMLVNNAQTGGVQVIILCTVAPAIIRMLIQVQQRKRNVTAIRNNVHGQGHRPHAANHRDANLQHVNLVRVKNVVMLHIQTVQEMGMEQ